MKKSLLVLVLLASVFAMEAQQTKRLTAEKHNEYGLIYTLPVSAFQVEIVAVKDIRMAGPFAKYSKIFTTNSDAILKNEVSWSIESVKVTPYGIPDTENRYLMQLKPGALAFIDVADDGMLLSINKDVEAPVLQSLSVVEVEGTPVTGREYLDFVDEDFIAAQSSYKQAQLLAEEIMEVREAKVSLTRGTAETMPTDGKQLEIMLESLEKQERYLMNAFTGSSWKERVVRTFTYCPDEEGRGILCKLNPSMGLVDADAKSGTPVYISVRVTEEAALPLDAKGEEKKLPKDAVMYCVPGVADLSITFNGAELYRKSHPMSQFGLVFGLNPSVFTDKKEPSYAVFDPATGALKELGTLK